MIKQSAIACLASVVFPLLFLSCRSVPLSPDLEKNETSRPTAREPVNRGVGTSPQLTEAIDHALASGWHDLHLLAECRTDEGFSAAEVFGNGVGIWDSERQFMLAKDQIRTLLEAFRQNDFAGMRHSYGGKNDPLPAEKQAPRIICRVNLALDGLNKQVVQLFGGRQSAELKGLAHRILDICRAPALAGIAARDLSDGLSKVAMGELAPEVFHLMLHRRAAPGVSGTEGESWLLRVDGRIASTRSSRPGRGYTKPIGFELQPEELANLVRIIRDQKVGELPINLYADHYTDLSVEVMKWHKSIQARHFAGMTATTHGEKQEHFDTIYRALEDLHRRVLAEGKLKAVGSGLELKH